jgi:hypothetical protein
MKWSATVVMQQMVYSKSTVEKYDFMLQLEKGRMRCTGRSCGVSRMVSGNRMFTFL